MFKRAFRYCWQVIPPCSHKSMVSLAPGVRTWVKLLVVVGVLLVTASVLVAQSLDSGGNGLGADNGGLSAMPSDQLLQQLGVVPQEMQQLKQESVGGGISAGEVQRLCMSITSKRLSPEDAQSIGRSLGLADPDVAQLVECARQSSRQLKQFGEMPTSRRASQPLEPSVIEQRFHAADTPYQLLAGPDLSQLRQFGYNLFSNRASQLAAFDNIPVGPDYIVGPGDELTLLLWGRINRSIKLPIQRDGTVLIPQIGPMSVAGLSFGQVQKLIVGRAQQIEGVQADVTMGRLRTIPVFVIGQVAEPGLQTVSGLAHMTDALLAAGGVRRTGSLRSIELRRGNRIIGHLDLYSLLLYGDASADQRLEPRDVIFVPVIGPVVAVAGDVKYPAIYELKGRETLAQVIKMAGGVSSFGYAQRVQVERVQSHEQRVALDVGLYTAQARDFAATDGDVIKVFSVLPDERNVVKLEGNVHRPGVYQWHMGLRVADLIRLGQGVADRTFFGYALLERRSGAARAVHFLPVKLGESLSSEFSEANRFLLPGDVLTIYSVGEIDQIPTVSVQGEVRKPGRYPLTDGMQVRDLIYEAGGLRGDAYLGNAELARTYSDGARARFVYESINLKGALNGNASDNVALRGGDNLFITVSANWHRTWKADLVGELMRPGPYVIRSGERLGSVLIRSGGLRPDAYLPGLILIRQSVKRIQQQALQRTSAQIQTEITRAALMPAEGNQQAQQPNLQQKAQALVTLRDMILESQRSQAIGRVVLNHLTDLNDLQGSPSDVALEDGDEIIVPRRPSAVNVMGEVYGASSVAYDPALTVADYLDLAGGLTPNAERDQILVVKTNGSILSMRSFKDRGDNRLFPLLPVESGGFMSLHLDPGDTIYVPSSFLYVNPLQRTLDITQIIANSAEGIAYAALLGTLL